MAELGEGPPIQSRCANRPVAGVIAHRDGRGGRRGHDDRQFLGSAFESRDWRTRQTVRMAALADIVFDARHPAALARFWAAVLDGYDVAPYDDAELERLRSIGVDDVEDDPTVLVESPGQYPRF